jgi:hypothetical protein
MHTIYTTPYAIESVLLEDHSLYRSRPHSVSIMFMDRQQPNPYIIMHQARVELIFDCPRHWTYFCLKYPQVLEDPIQAHRDRNPQCQVIVKEVPGPSAYSVTAVPEKAD